MAGADLAVAAGAHVGIDPDRHVRAHALVGGDAGDERHLRLGLHIDLGHAQAQGEGDLGRRLADARKDDAIRLNPCRDGSADLALGDGVSAGAQPGQGGKDG